MACKNRLKTGRALGEALLISDKAITMLNFDRQMIGHIEASEARRLVRGGDYEGNLHCGRIKSLRPLKPSLPTSHKLRADRFTHSKQFPESFVATAASFHEANRARRLSEADGVHSESEWQSVLDRYGRVCLRCGIAESQTQFGKLTKDHVLPLASGGSDYASNLQPLCGSCNSWKGNREMDFRTSAAVA